MINDIELFYRVKKTKPIIIGVTGSNGKTTSVSLLELILKYSGKSVFCGGNIGKSPIEFVLGGEKEDIVLLELSSFQLESVDLFHPDIAGILNVNMTHEERYKNIEEYRNSKLRIFRKNNSQQHFFCDSDTLNYVSSAKSYDSKEVLNDLQQTYNFSDWKLPGKHNILNLSLCVKIAKQIDVDDSAIQKAMIDFRGVKDRIEYVGIHEGIKVYNDSKSTNLFSTMTAIKSFPGKKILLILGGQIRDRKNMDLSKLKKIEASVHKIILFGELSQLSEVNCYRRVPKLSQIKKEDLPDDAEVILFSPGCPSFDEFDNYGQRGSFFKRIFSSD